MKYKQTHKQMTDQFRIDQEVIVTSKNKTRKGVIVDIDPFNNKVLVNITDKGVSRWCLPDNVQIKES